MTYADLHLYWWKRIPNVGDLANPLLVRALSGSRVRWSASPRHQVLTAIGSVVQFAKPGWRIWGSGCINDHLPVPPRLTFHAVRGPRTAQVIARAGYPAGLPLGDPALLLPTLYKRPRSRIRYEWGIIPHYVDYPWLSYVAAKERVTSFLGRDGARRFTIINPMGSMANYLDQMWQCERIASSSLHGLIIADAYGIPNVWFATRVNPAKALNLKPNRYIDDHFKYHDYFESVTRREAGPVWTERRLPWEEFERRADDWRPIRWDPTGLLAAFPEAPTEAPAGWDRYVDETWCYYRSMSPGDVEQATDVPSNVMVPDSSEMVMQ